MKTYRQRACRRLGPLCGRQALLQSIEYGLEEQECWKWSGERDQRDLDQVIGTEVSRMILDSTKIDKFDRYRSPSPSMTMSLGSIYLRLWRVCDGGGVLVRDGTSP